MKFKRTKKALLALSLAGVATCASACKIEDFFVFNNGYINPELIKLGIEPFEGCKNSIFFALYNYYGFEGQSFTNRWMGMNDALANHGIEVTGWEENKDAQTFKIKRLANCDLPDDADIFMVNNQEWDSGIQFTTPIAEHKPMAIISTCNGAEFAAAPIKSSGIAISNATMAGFSDYYRDCFENGTISYIAAKTAASILPIVAATVDAVANKKAMKMPNGEALVIESKNFPIQTLNEYNLLDDADSIGANGDSPLYRKADLDPFFDKTNENYGVEKLLEWQENHNSKESILASREANKTVTDTPRGGTKFKLGVIKPSAVNDQVRKYVDYVTGYCASVYNFEIVNADVKSGVTQIDATKTLCSSGCKAIISFQDDTDRAEAIKVANQKRVFFGAGGACINDVDYPQVKDLPYFVGSAGTTVSNDREATREMTEYYLNCMIERAKGYDELVKYQTAVKGIVIPDEIEEEE